MQSATVQVYVTGKYIFGSFMFKGLIHREATAKLNIGARKLNNLLFQRSFCKNL